MQYCVFFDAVGTLIEPDPPVADAYHLCARQLGIVLDRNVIAQRFGIQYRKRFLAPSRIPNADLPPGYRNTRYQTDDETEKTKWKLTVQGIFGDAYSEQLFSRLWQHFAQPANWRRLDRAGPLIESLQHSGVPAGVASNFDSRLLPIIQFHFPTIDRSMVFWSTGVGYAKPDVRFFREIEKRARRQMPVTGMLMIGDDWRLDIDAARRAGWNTIWKSGPGLPSIHSIRDHFRRNT